MSSDELKEFFFSFLGIITTGSDEYYIESYILHFSKDRKIWKLYKGVLSKEKKVHVELVSLGRSYLRPAEAMWPLSLHCRPPGVNN